jgi:uncharacterized Zn-binding protein involved in type VI secretion
MSNQAARAGDTVLNDRAHCHAPIHPPAPVPTPLAHPPQPLAILTGCQTVNIGGMPAARVGDRTLPCAPPGCIPAGPGTVARGSATVTIGGQFAARVGDIVSFPACIGPIPSTTGKVLGPGCPTVTIGG